MWNVIKKITKTVTLMIEIAVLVVGAVWLGQIDKQYLIYAIMIVMVYAQVFFGGKKN